MVKRPRPQQWHLIFTGAGLLAAVVVAVSVSQLPPIAETIEPTSLQNLRPQANRPVDAQSFAAGVDSGLDSVLAELGIVPSWIARNRRPAAPGSAIDTVSIRVPVDLPVASVNQLLTDFIAWQGGHVVRGEEQQQPTAVDLTCGIDSTVTTLFRLRRDRALTRTAGRIALVIDVSDAPAVRVQRLARMAQSVTMITVDDAITLTPELMIGEHQITQGTPDHSQAIDAADGTAEDVQRHLWALAERSANQGKATASAHLRPATLQALEEMLPRLERRGYQFVTWAEYDN